MQCTSCKYPGSRVVYTLTNDLANTKTRRHECLRCGSRFTTEEHLKVPKKLNDDRVTHKGKK